MTSSLRVLSTTNSLTVPRPSDVRYGQITFGQFANAIFAQLIQLFSQDIATIHPSIVRGDIFFLGFCPNRLEKDKFNVYFELRKADAG